MGSAVTVLPPDQLKRVGADYAAAMRERRKATAIGIGVLILAIAAAMVMGEVDLSKFFANIDRFPNYIIRLFHFDSGALVFTDVREWFWGLRPWGIMLLETLLIAYVGTILGAVFGFVLCFLASANLTTNPWIRNAAKRFLEICRTVPELVFALIFVIAFGLGPVPGVLAIAIHTMGALGKQFSEVVENIDMKPVEGIVATGGTWSEVVRFAAVPQVLSNFASYTLLRFEVNVRGAAVMGFVGAGGIGQDLLEAIRKFYYSDVSAILVMIIATVMIIDLFTERLRHSLISLERH